MTQSFDLVVVGGGSGGLAAAQRAAEYGARVALVEPAPLGGTCVNMGCVPKKVMWTAAHLAQALADAREYGFDVTVGGHDWAGLKARRDAYIARLNGIYAANLAKKGIEHVVGYGRFTGPDCVVAGGRELRAAHVIIATGGRPVRPAVPGAGLGLVSDDFFRLAERPQRVALVGTGYVGVELGGVFRALGSEVTMVCRHASLLRSFDEMLQRGLIEAMEADGVRFAWHTTPAGLTRGADGLVMQATDGRQLGPFDAVLWAVGREPATADLGLASAGVATDEAGFIPTDRYQVTNVPHIYAVGDVTGRAALTPVAIAAGRRLCDRVFGGKAGRHLDYRDIPTVVFSHPTIGTCGLSEADARQQIGDAVEVYTSTFVPLYYGVMSHKPKMRMKLVVVGDDERVVGCHVIGPGADEMLQGFAVAIRMGARKADLDDTVAIHPTAAEELVTMR
jgi:glutathione reductase (NADPH)